MAIKNMVQISINHSLQGFFGVFSMPYVLNFHVEW